MYPLKQIFQHKRAHAEALDDIQIKFLVEEASTDSFISRMASGDRWRACNANFQLLKKDEVAGLKLIQTLAYGKNIDVRWDAIILESRIFLILKIIKSPTEIAASAFPGVKA